MVSLLTIDISSVGQFVQKMSLEIVSVAKHQDGKHENRKYNNVRFIFELLIRLAFEFLVVILHTNRCKAKLVITSCKIRFQLAPRIDHIHAGFR